ncbi:MAG: PadR family transcriptional regulator [Thermoprotei archaeon]
MAYQRLVKTLTKGNIWLYVCRSLLEKPKYGYEIVKELKEKYKLNAATVTIYMVLQKMENEEIIRPLSGTGLPGIKYYQLTEKGQQLFKNGILFIEERLKILKGETDGSK